MKISKKEEGQGLVEYALVLVLVAVAIILILTLLGSTVVVTYARVMGGLSGQSLTMSGDEYIILEADIQASGSGDTCNITGGSAKVVVLNDGALQTEGSANLPYSVNGTSGSVSVTIDGSGISEINFPSVSTGCPIVLTNPHGYRQVINP
ncbi:MAG: hypothetical protein R3E31_27675 [Chloroflexota bacterium]|nr:hypothetical protein [Anaerolineales bacterium]MCA9974179.1 hypothetical protein [Anaerolineales bacterium]